MDLVVIHGPPGIGKRTISERVAELTGYGLFNLHMLGASFSGIFDWGTPPFYALRDELYPVVVRRALAGRDDGLVMTFIFEPTVRLEHFEEFAAAADRSLFVGLVASLPEHARRITDPSRPAEKRWADAGGLADLLATGEFDFPPLPARSIVLDTTAMTPEAAAAEIVTQLERT